MSNEQEVSTTVVLQALEGVVKWLKDKGESETEILKLVSQVCAGNIVGGKYTDEYVMLAAEAEKNKSNIILP